MRVDKANGNALWLDNIMKDLECLNEWQVVRILKIGEKYHEEYQDMNLDDTSISLNLHGSGEV